jgi:hypothetical protein
MKKYLLLSAALMLFSVSLSAQYAGRWTGKGPLNGKNQGFTLELKSNGTYSMAYDLNPNDLSVKGRWMAKGDALILKSGSNKVQLKRISPKETRNGFLVIITNKKSNRVHGLPMSQSKIWNTLFGSDGGLGDAH